MPVGKTSNRLISLVLRWTRQSFP